MKRPNNNMDKRCLRKLQEFPETFCPLAVLRLKALRNAGRELTEEEESRCPGCNYAIAHQMSNYCFFKFMAEHYPNNNLTDIEIAHYNSISADTVKKLEKTAIAKLKEDCDFKEILDTYGSDKIIDDSD